MPKDKSSQKDQVGNRKAGSRPSNKQQHKKNEHVPLQNAPAAISRRVVSKAPREHVKGGTRTIHYREYVQDILGSVLYSAITFPCNPGLANLFAWLSGQALFYQEYTVKKLSFHFDTQKATSLSGKVMFAFSQDSADAAPASKQELLEHQMKASGAVWQPFHLPIPMNNFPALGKSRFVRGGTLAANLDQKTYDIGSLIVAVQGMADASAVGELYVEYEIELRTPLQSNSQLANALSEVITGVSPGQTTFLGTTPTLAGGIDMTATVNTLTFNKTGQFLVVTHLVGTGLDTTQTPVISASTATVTKFVGISNAAADAGTIAMCMHSVNVTARGQTAVFDYTTMSTTISASATRVALYNTSLG